MIDEAADQAPVNQSPPNRIAAGDCLVVVDVQNDFLPGGALAVPGGDGVVPVLNRYLALFAERSLPIFATRDWHPLNHCSFREQGGPWPPHCVANTPGAAFAPGLALPSTTVVISKGTDPRQEAYSGFQGTDLAGQLQAAGVRRAFVGGLATEFCVLATVNDALAEHFSAVLLLDAIQALELNPGDALRAEQEMFDRGARSLRWDEIS
jgi:nicotinamidase/pyrazinamidase